MSDMWESTWLVNRTGQIVSTDDAFGRYVPHPAEVRCADDVIGRALTDYISCPETDRIFQAMLDRVRYLKKPLELTYRRDEIDTRRHLRMRIEPMDGDRGLVIRARTEKTEPRRPIPLLDATQPRNEASLPICCWCNRVETPAGWVEAEDASEFFDPARPLPKLKQSLCQPCKIEVVSKAFISS